MGEHKPLMRLLETGSLSVKSLIGARRKGVRAIPVRLKNVVLAWNASSTNTLLIRTMFTQRVGIVRTPQEHKPLLFRTSNKDISLLGIAVLPLRAFRWHLTPSRIEECGNCILSMEISFQLTVSFEARL